MSVLVTPDEMRVAEQATFATGVSPGELMRRAGVAIADWTERITAPVVGRRRRALGLIGPGNNGGDALVALATLHERDWECAAVLVGRAGIGELPAGATHVAAIRIVDLESIGWFAPDVIVDGIFGIGGRAALPEGPRRAIAAARDQRATRAVPLIAVDLPSGVDGGSGDADPGAFPADVTLCLGLPKIGLTREPAATFAGELVVVDIGIVAPAAGDRPVLLDERQARAVVPTRHASAHKSHTGAVLVVGGAEQYYGAPLLAGLAALRAGAGLVTLATPEPVVAAIAAQAPELTYVPLAGDGSRQAEQITAFLERQPGRFTALVIGPGLGRDERAKRLLDRLMGHENRHLQRVPIVLDADGLFWLAARDDVGGAIRHATCVLTPHPGEMARLLHVAHVSGDTFSVARGAARAWGQVVVYKGGYSAVAAPDGRVWCAPRAMPELATAGTGDVLSGLIGGMLAQGLEPLDAVRLAMFVGALAGRHARGMFGVASVIATDVIARVGPVLQRLAEPQWNATWLLDSRTLG